jgi:NADH:ubiquinone oxidoreductase subunit F (NADH-binding)
MRYTVEQIKLLSREYFEDLQSENVTYEEFEIASREARKRCSFFPKVADILSQVDKIKKQQAGESCDRCVKCKHWQDAFTRKVCEERSEEIRKSCPSFVEKAI